MAEGAYQIVLMKDGEVVRSSRVESAIAAAKGGLESLVQHAQSGGCLKLQIHGPGAHGALTMDAPRPQRPAPAHPTKGVKFAQKDWRR